MWGLNEHNFCTKFFKKLKLIPSGVKALTLKFAHFANKPVLERCTTALTAEHK